jgi:hypothetical protein
VPKLSRRAALLLATIVIVAGLGLAGYLAQRSGLIPGCISFQPSSNLNQAGGCDVRVGRWITSADCTQSTFPETLSVAGSTNYKSLSARGKVLLSHHCILSTHPQEELQVFTESVNFTTTVFADFQAASGVPSGIYYVIGNECTDRGPCDYATVSADARTVVAGEPDHFVGVTPMADLTGFTTALKQGQENRMIIQWSGEHVTAWLNGSEIGRAALVHGKESGWPGFSVINSGTDTVDVGLTRFAVFSSD